METGVIIVGAGPVGLMLACELHLGGVNVTVYDKLAAPSGESRALGFNRRAAESLDQRGLLPQLGEFRWGPMGHFGGVRFDLGMLDENHSGVLGLSQARTEGMLGGRLAELGVPVRRGYEVTGVRETPEGVVVSFEGPEGRGEDTARYVVGCDGPRSTVRAAAGIPAQGWEATRGMYTAEITGVTLRPRPIGERLPGGHMVVCTPLGDGRYRIVIHDKGLPPHQNPDSLTFAQVADAWQRLTGESVHHAEAQWMWACGNAAGLADEYRRGRVLLAGDAAHEMPPLAAWGLSAGVQDAVNLGWKLAAAVNGWAPEGLLDTYHAERHPIGQQLIRNAQAASMLYLGDADMDPLRGVLGELVAHKDAAAHLAGIVSGLGIRYGMGPGDHPLLGRRMPPDRELVLSDGSRTRIAGLLHSARGVLVATDGAGAAAQSAEDWADRIDIVTGAWADGPKAAPEAVLVRPDGYVAWTSPGSDGDLTDVLAHWFGTTRATAQPATSGTHRTGA
ncbi:FAD-dependent monooxygenase [Streptomyces sp. KMM 9044]|uniref:FAD-dependent monooxygenase n=1 Tax=Streptomyces sp. KMM 9044 TaxID=2744474 RepID=UPI0021512983|nr:FAD-dependent monooxygenase [Streptomyces sp. KMM 9044]WAX76376.1 FAD-dependent monooxygenase [Streptomyces sp. KMM 9044]